ncbi:MAG: DUF4230 domain-containing protein [Saprospiraceae bacterium]|nr:DUF4230 domain-containing protein [Saprospiraceae bacterium]
MADNDLPQDSRISIGKWVIIILGVALVGIYLFRNIYNKARGYTNVPKEVQLKYVPSDYNMGIDTDNAIAILSNPHRYRREFNDMVYDLNMSILNHVANRMDLPTSAKSQLDEEYDKHHPYLRNLYFNDFVQMKDTTSALYQTWYDNESTSAVEILKEIASKYTCFLVNHVITSLIETQNGKVFAKGSKVDTPCGIAMVEALNPMVKRMEERAAIEDFGKSRDLLQEKVERVIAELATMEVSDKKGINKKLQTKIWGFNVSSSDIEVSAISRLKIGFKLNEYFDIDLSSKNRLVTVTLPNPTILSHEVYPKIDKLDIGWMREVKDVDLNKNFNVLRKEFRREAMESDIMDKAKQRAVELMNTMFSPLVSNMKGNYKLRVKFQNISEEEAFDEDNSEFSSID